MRICFLGVGEAFDEMYPNTAILVSVSSSLADSQTPGEHGMVHVLLDCGFTAPAAYYRHAPLKISLSTTASETRSESTQRSRSRVQPDAIWISHFHGDHFLGVPLMLLRFWEEGRSKALSILGPRGVEDKIWAAFELAYPGFRERIAFPVSFLDITPDMHGEFLGLRWSVAANAHSASAPCMSLRLEYGGKSVVYSGDGRSTAATERLARDADLLIHEAYDLDGETPGHGTVTPCLALARQARVKRLALVHVNRTVRAQRAEEIRAMLFAAAGVTATLPEPGTVIEL